MTTITLTDSELATVLHGLRLIQCEGRIEGCAAGDCQHFADVPALDNAAIDTLCEHLNTGTLGALAHVYSQAGVCLRCGEDAQTAGNICMPLKERQAVARRMDARAKLHRRK